MDNFEKVRLTLGDPKERIKLEYSKNPQIYRLTTVIVLLSILLFIPLKAIENVYISIIIFINIILWFSIGCAIRNTYINNYKIEINIILSLIEENKIDNFMSYLSKRFEPEYLVEIIIDNTAKNLLFNVLFLSLSSIAIYIFKLKFNELEVYSWFFIFWMYMYLFYNVFRFLKPADMMITANALKNAKKILMNMENS